ncbi:MAG: hypothetical protein ACXAC2_13695 [Candidatus Kariarchaeaceae archaeon]|jgi:hypothetical protein
MTQINYLFPYRYIVLFFLIFCSLNLSLVRASDNHLNSDVYELSGTKNHHYVKKISIDWDLLTPQKNLSATVNIPLLAPRDINRITFSKTFQIPDSLKNRKLVIWFPGINGIADVNINNIQVLERLNLSSGFKIQIPMNLLNISGENNLDIDIRRPNSLDEGIPKLVNIFKSQQNIGITGDVYLEWLPLAYIADLTYTYKMNKLSFSYQLNIDHTFNANNEINPKVLCEEVIRDPRGTIVFSRFEYLDLKAMTKKFNRSTFINNPVNWSPESPEFYLLRVTAKSGTGLIAFHEQKIGLRDISFNNQKIFINNEHIQLNGINYRLDLPVYSYEQDNKSNQDIFIKQLKDDFIDIKNLGFNAIRFPNTPPHKVCFYLADSLGLYLFSEIGLWRIPERYFRDDQLLQISKKVADEIIQQHSLNPSFTALGIGNEIPIHLPAVKKYMLILKGYIEQKSPILLYLIPLNLELISQRPITEFYMINKYDLSLLKDFTEIIDADFFKQGSALIFSNVGFSVSNIFDSNADIDFEEIQSVRVQKFFELTSDLDNFEGFFLESYRDWIADSPARLSQLESSGDFTYPYGLITYENKKRDLYFRIPKFLNGDYSLASVYKSSSKKSNFFSITVFIFSIAILFIYRQNYRFRENLKRSMAHPYGFFVDLRDRRIISILNSTIIGLYTNFLVSTLIAAYIYYMRDSILMEEMLSSMLVPLKVKFIYLELIKSPFYISMLIWFSFYLLQLTIVILLKIINLLATEKIRFKQYLAVCNWAGAPLFLLFPVSMLSYHLMHFKMAHPLIIFILFLFFFWYNFRLGNGLRVLLSMRTYKIVVLLIFIYGGTLFAFGAIYESNYGLLSYLQLLMDAYPLF